jgi:hypothetical protein
MWHGGRDLPPWRWAAGSWRHVARSWRHAAWSCRRKFYALRRQGLNVVGHDGRNLPPWGLASYVYFSKFLVRTFIFRKSKKIACMR